MQYLSGVSDLNTCISAMTVPLFPELREPLLEVFGEAEPGTEHVITRYRDTRQNLRTQLCRIIRKAGLKVWQKLWHNCRSARQTELAERYPIHVVCAWLGNSRAVAQSHYLQVTDAHLERAAKPDEKRRRIWRSQQGNWLASSRTDKGHK